MSDYAHGEAFMLMTYRERGGTEEEVIWNSRDGVTPFIVPLRSGAEASHVDWQLDRRDPDYTPPIGSRIFVDLHPEKAAQYAETNVDRWLADPERRDQFIATFGTREEGIRRMALSYMDPPGQPDIIEVTEDTLLWLKQGART